MSQAAGQRHTGLGFSIVQAVRVGHFLRIVFDQPLDSDMPPDLEDVSVVLSARAGSTTHQIISPIAIQLRNVERDSKEFSVLTLVFEKELKTLQQAALRYHPHQWFMWSLSKDEPIPAFVMAMEVTHRAADEKTRLEPSQLQRLKRQASDHFLQVKRSRSVAEGRAELERIQSHQFDVNLNKELIQYQSLVVQDFKAEAGEMWLTITDVIICQPSADDYYLLRLTVLEAIPENCVLRIAFQASRYPLAATDGSSVDKFFLEIELGASKGTSALSNNIDTRFDATIDLEHISNGQRPDLTRNTESQHLTRNYESQHLTRNYESQQRTEETGSILQSYSEQPDASEQDGDVSRVFREHEGSPSSEASLEDSLAEEEKDYQPEQKPKKRRRRPRTGNDPVNEFDGLFSQPVSDQDLLQQLEGINNTTRPKQNLPLSIKLLSGIVAAAVIWLIIALFNLFVLLPSGTDSKESRDLSSAADQSSKIPADTKQNNSNAPVNPSASQSNKTAQPNAGVNNSSSAEKQSSAGCSLNFSSGNQYIGECDPQNKPNGRGVYTWSSGSRYEGEFSHGKRQGLGKMLYSSGSRYEGNWVNDKKQGEGTYWVDNGDRFEGQFDAGRMTENGTCFPKSGESYQGFCRN